MLLWRPEWFVRLPDPANLAGNSATPSSLIVDRAGNLLYEIIDPHAGSHRPLTIDEIPPTLRQAVVATEDASFYSNPGIDVLGMLRAAWTNARAREIRSGASTITQQVARNLLMGSAERSARTWQRKVREALLALRLTRTLSKDEILALYLNETYLGNMAYGVEAAARAYYGKPVTQLDLAESALLAGLPQSPSTYNPLIDLPAAKARQQTVLGLMVKAGYISQAEADLAYAEPLQFASAAFAMEAPHYAMWVRQQLSVLVGEEVVRRGGLRIETTLDLDLQRVAEDAVRRQIAALNQPSTATAAQPGVSGLPLGHNVRNAAVVVLDAESGEILAMVGSPDYGDARSDGAVNAALALRQPGSAVKPVTYAAAFARGYAPGSVVLDVPTSYVTREGEPYLPLNYDSLFHGPVRLRQALACSYNISAVRLLDAIGIDAFVSQAQQLGLGSINAPERQGLALTLGGNEVRLLDLTAAYAAFANGGTRVNPLAVRRITSADGTLLYSAAPGAGLGSRVLDERVAWLLTDVLADNQARVPAFGQGSALELPFAAAVKTGTTSDWRDNWTVGYAASAVVGVWVGNADGEPMREVTGLSGAAPVWNTVMRAARGRAGDGLGSGASGRPAKIVEVDVCPLSGLLPSPACQTRVREFYLAEDVPTQTCDWHVLVTVDTRDSSAADDETPADYRVRRRIVRWPTEALAWAQDAGLVDIMTLRLYAGLGGQSAQGGDAMPTAAANAEHGPVRLLSPNAGSVFLLSVELPGEVQQLEVAALCEPKAGARELRLWVDDELWHTWPGDPAGVYRVMWPLQVGEHEFVVEAEGSAGAVRSEPVRVRVEAGS
ncbi:MAG: PBP1A family penicillin-binding protein [Chloroflexi bacterium]|nr:PBP1A family penicillin-binding protein [Chloroflexota bacterium]